MSRSVSFLRDAGDEFGQAVDWYDQQRAGYGVTFSDAVQNVLDRIAPQPDFYPIVYGDVRERRTSGFPYYVYYREEVGCIVVVGVVHAARDPAVWQRRV
ncbi:MAG TPA: hypothetical protein VGE52_05250 [Pirellulales bacterium]